MAVAPPPVENVQQPNLLSRLGIRQDSVLGRNQAIVIPFTLIVLLLILSGIRQPGFLSGNNIRQQLVLATFLGTVAAGQTLVILTGGIDLSVAWTLNFAAVLFTQSLDGRTDAVHIVWSTLLALLAGSAVGIVNGLGIAFLRIPSLVMTLGMNTVMLGATLVYTNGTPQGSPPHFARVIATEHLFGFLPWAVVYWAGLSIIMIGLLKYSVFGRRIYAIGNNRRAAMLSGASVRFITVCVYACSGLTAGVAGILLAGYANNTYLGMGDAFVLQSIAAVVIGGTSILGGTGGYGGTIAGAIMIVLLQNSLQVAGIKPAGQQILYGVIILMMLFIYGRARQIRE